MAVGVARSNSICNVCGGKIIAGVHTIKWAPSIKGSARHEECYGKPDRFDSYGNPLQTQAVESTPQATSPAEMAAAVQTVPIPKVKKTFEPIPVESTKQAAPQPQPKPNPAPKHTSSASADPIVQAMMNALRPHLDALVEQNNSGSNLDEERVREIAQTVAAELDEEVISTVKDRIDEQVDSAVKQAVAQHGTITIQVKKPNGDLKKLEGLMHRDQPKLLKLMQRRKNIYLPGPAGSGKSTAARIGAKAICTKTYPDGLPFYYVSLNPQASPTRIEGYNTPSGAYIQTLFRKAYTEGGVFCADEVDNSMANLWTSINNALDSDLGSFPDGMVKRHEDFIFIGTGNTNLNGDAVYRDRKALDKATISRFVFLYWDYDPELEKKITLARNQKALPWLNWVHKIRAWAKDNNPQMYAYTHPRACYDGADLLADGFSVEETAEMVVFKWTFDETAKRAALTANPLPTLDMAL